MDAEVSADDVSVLLTTTTALVAPVAHTIDDAGQAMPNGRLDPGETVDLTMTFRNFGEPATGISVLVSCVDPGISVLSNSAALTDLDTGDVADIAVPFTLEAAASLVGGTPIILDVTVNHDDGGESHAYAMVVGQYQYLVWDPEPIHSSGPVLHDVLSAEGYRGVYSGELPADLGLYRSLFVCLGFYSDNRVIGAGTPEALAIEGFAAQGGCVYMEGGDCWYYDPQSGGHNFSALFGINGVADGSGDMNMALGVAGTFTAGMQIPFVGGSSYVDHLAPLGDAFTIFNNSSPSYGCGVARDTETYRTVGVSFLFGGLADFDPPSTRAHLARAIMQFFLQDVPLAAPVIAPLPVQVTAYPNPFNPQTTVEFANPRAGRVRLAVFDLAGRRVRTLVDDQRPAGRQSVVWDGRDDAGRTLGSGVYLARMVAGQQTAQRKLLLCK